MELSTKEWAAGLSISHPIDVEEYFAKKEKEVIKVENSSDSEDDVPLTQRRPGTSRSASGASPSTSSIRPSTVESFTPTPTPILCARSDGGLGHSAAPVMDINQMLGNRFPIPKQLGIDESLPDIPGPSNVYGQNKDKDAMIAELEQQVINLKREKHPNPTCILSHRVDSGGKLVWMFRGEAKYVRSFEQITTKEDFTKLTHKYIEWAQSDAQIHRHYGGSFRRYLKGTPKKVRGKESPRGTDTKRRKSSFSKKPDLQAGDSSEIEE